MKITALFAAFISSVAASPAIVWNANSKDQIHNAEVTGLRSLVEAQQPSVVFVVERDENGSEGLTKLTSSGSLPKVASKYSEASSINHYVRGIENVEKAIKEFGSATATTLDNYMKEAAAMVQATVNNDGSSNVSGDVLIVSIPNEAEPSEIDSIVSSAIEDETVGSVVLTSVRGLSEVKFERNLMAKQEYFEAMEYTSRRRLEDAQGDDDNESQDIYFVHFTPNIFSGLLFFFFFASITFTGIGCMGQIAGQDLYVTKYPTIGREA